jgi:hypothetical protein
VNPRLYVELLEQSRREIQGRHRDRVIGLDPCPGEFDGCRAVPLVSDKRVPSDTEVAARLGVSPFTVRAWRRKGQGPRFMKMRRAVRSVPRTSRRA